MKVADGKMVFTKEETMDIENRKEEIKLNLLETQHKCNIEELEMQLKIEAVKAFQNTDNSKDSEGKEFRTKMIDIIFDKDGRAE